jgi:hypothetical protein
MPRMRERVRLEDGLKLDFNRGIASAREPGGASQCLVCIL